MTTIFRRELRSYFTNMHGYIFGAFLLLFTGIFCYAANLRGGYTQLEYALGNASFIFMLIVPVVTMKCIAEEKHQRTDQLLYSLPIKSSDVVLGKFAALYAVFGVPMLIMCIYPLILGMFGEVNYAATYSCILGFFLLGGALLSLGLFISSLTESQVIAAVISFIAVMLCYFMSSLASMMPTAAWVSVVAFSVVSALVGLCVYILSRDIWVAGCFGLVSEIAVVVWYLSDKAAFEGMFARCISALSIYDIYYNFSVGTFDLGAVVYYVSIMAVCLFLTVQSLERKRYN